MHLAKGETSDRTTSKCRALLVVALLRLSRSISTTLATGIRDVAIGSKAADALRLRLPRALERRPVGPGSPGRVAK